MSNLTTIGQTSTGFHLRASVGSPLTLPLMNTTDTALAIEMTIGTVSGTNMAIGDVCVIRNTGVQATVYLAAGNYNDWLCQWLNAPGDSLLGTNIPNGSSFYSQSFIMNTTQNLSFTSGQQFVLSGTSVLLHCSVVEVLLANQYVVQWLGTSGDTGIGIYSGGLNIQIQQASQTSFTPQKFFVFQGQVWCRDTGGNFYQYGGATGQSFDTCQATVVTPWMDLGKPTMRKTAESVDFAVSGAWTISGSMDFNGVYNAADSPVKIAQTTSASPTALQGSFQGGEKSWSDDGYHVQFQCTSTDFTSPAPTLSELVFNFKENDPK